MEQLCISEGWREHLDPRRRDTRWETTEELLVLRAARLCLANTFSCWKMKATPRCRNPPKLPLISAGAAPPVSVGQCRGTATRGPVSSCLTGEQAGVGGHGTDCHEQHFITLHSPCHDPSISHNTNLKSLPLLANQVLTLRRAF